MEKIKCKQFSKQCSEACSQTVKLKRGNTEHHLAERTESGLIPRWVSLKQKLPTSVFNRRPTFSVSVFCIFPYLFFLRLAKRTRCCFLSYMRSSQRVGVRACWIFLSSPCRKRQNKIKYHWRCTCVERVHPGHRCKSGYLAEEQITMD